MIGGHGSCLILCSMETAKIVWNVDEAKLTAKWFCIAQHAWSTKTLRQKELHISYTQWLVKAECLMFYLVFTLQASITHRLFCACRRREVHTSRHSTLGQSAVIRNLHDCLHPKLLQGVLQETRGFHYFWNIELTCISGISNVASCCTQRWPQAHVGRRPPRPCGWCNRSKHQRGSWAMAHGFHCDYSCKVLHGWAHNHIVYILKEVS